jgi:hypothetical protein
MQQQTIVFLHGPNIMLRRVGMSSQRAGPCGHWEGLKEPDKEGGSWDDGLRGQLSPQRSANSGGKHAKYDKRAKGAEQCVETEIGSAFHGAPFS